MTEKIKDISGIEKKYRLVASDMDGTLLDDESRISERTLSAIHAAEKAGIAFTISTGRAHCAVVHFLEQIGARHPLITFNGAMIVEPDGKILYSCELDSSRALPIWRLGQSLDTTIIVWSKGRLYANRMTDAVRSYIAMSREVVFAICTDDDIEAIAAQGITKFLFIDSPERISHIAEHECGALGDGVRCFKSKPIYLEFVDSSVSKGRAVEQLCAIMGVDVSESIAFGDEQNDLEMIRAAGLGVAMANATAAVKDAAGFITASNTEDGVALVLEALALGEDEGKE